jgi:hypothetical protein
LYDIDFINLRISINSKPPPTRLYSSKLYQTTRFISSYLLSLSWYKYHRYCVVDCARSSKRRCRSICRIFRRAKKAEILLYINNFLKFWSIFKNFEDYILHTSKHQLDQLILLSISLLSLRYIVVLLFEEFFKVPRIKIDEYLH